MPAPKKITKAVAQPTEPTVEEAVVDAEALLTAEQERDARAAREELLEGMPELRPAHRFRLRHKNDFEALRLDAIKSGAFDAVKDLRNESNTTVDRYEKYLTFRGFLGKVDEFAESIAVNPEEYAAWAESLTEPEAAFLALFSKYVEELGE